MADEKTEDKKPQEEKASGEGAAATTGALEGAEAADSGAATTKDGKPIMHVKVYSPFKVFYDQESFSITGINATGPFDILPHHHNFITLLNACELQIAPVNDKTTQKIRISGGLMHVKADRVTVFLDI